MSAILIPLLVSILPHSAPPVLAVKTNVPLWAATVMNVEPEIFFSRRWSADVPLMWCPWFISESKALRVFATQPEIRFRLTPGLKGHYIGLHGSVAWFNIKNGNYRYQDVGRPLIGCGISYGYSLTFRKNWIADFSIGGGYASMRYDRFFNIPNGAKADTRRTSYWGIDRLTISIGYMIDI